MNEDPFFVIIGLLEGTRPPQTELEKTYIEFMGGVKGPRKDWPHKFITCDTCGGDWNAVGFPLPTGKWIFPYRCKPCRIKTRHLAPKARERLW